MPLPKQTSLVLISELRLKLKLVQAGVMVVASPAPAPYAYEDRYYIIRDADNNCPTNWFTSIGASGQRGKPEIAYALVKKDRKII